MEWTMVTMVFVGPWATTRKTLVILMHEEVNAYSISGHRLFRHAVTYFWFQLSLVFLAVLFISQLSSI